MKDLGKFIDAAIWCNLNGHLINHIMYADDLVLISPSSAGLSQLLRECEKFGTRQYVGMM